MVKRNSLKFLSIFIGATLVASTNMIAQEKTVVGAAAMLPAKNIVENVANSKDHTTLALAVTSAGLAETLQGAGPFTFFAPTNSAFNKLPIGTVETLSKPENKAALAALLSYHVVPGNLNSTSLLELIKKNGGKYTAKTVQGGDVTFTLKDKNIILQDEKGGISKITIKDVYQNNGVMHVVDTVIMPNG